MIIVVTQVEYYPGRELAHAQITVIDDFDAHVRVTVRARAEIAKAGAREQIAHPVMPLHAFRRVNFPNNADWTDDDVVAHVRAANPTATEILHQADFDARVEAGVAALEVAR